MAYDWAVDSYLAEELDKESHKRDRAESYLAELESGKERIFQTLGTTAVSMGTAGAMAYASQTLFRDKATNKPGMLQIGPKDNGIGADFLLGVVAKLSALFAHKWIPSHMLPYVDALGTGSLDHWAVVTAQHAGAAAAANPPAKTSGVHGPRPVLGGGSPDRVPVMGGGNRNTNRPEMGGGVGADHRDPTQYMTPAQRTAWQDYG